MHIPPAPIVVPDHDVLVHIAVLCSFFSSSASLILFCFTEYEVVLQECPRCTGRKALSSV